MELQYNRVILKVSGEALSGGKGFGIDDDVLNHIAEQVIEVANLGVEIGVVIGGGNFWRGREGYGMDRTTADHMGMLATVINALAMQDSLEKMGALTRVMTAIDMQRIAEPYIRRRAIRHMEKKRIVVFACGTGNPFFTTDTAAALRAADVDAQALLLAKNVDGVYDCDPKTHPEAKKIDKLRYLDVINNGLAVMDSTACTLCMENDIPILAFGITQADGSNAIRRVLTGENIGTLIS